LSWLGLRNIDAESGNSCAHRAGDRSCCNQLFDAHIDFNSFVGRYRHAVYRTVTRQRLRPKLGMSYALTMRTFSFAR
jgi:hypothetical protein